MREPRYKPTPAPAYVKIVIVPGLLNRTYGWYLEDAEGYTLHSAPQCNDSRANACRAALKARRELLPPELPF